MKLKTRYSKAMTLVEIVVVMAVGVIVLGLLLAIFISTSKGVDKAISKDMLLQEIILVSDQVKNLLEYCVPSTMLSVDPGVPEIFSANEIRIVSSAKGKVAVHTIKNVSENKEGQSVEHTYKSLGENSSETKEFLGASHKEVNLSIRFKYADSFDGTEPIWRSSLEKPALISFTITAGDARSRVDPKSQTFTVSFYK